MSLRRVRLPEPRPEPLPAAARRLLRDADARIGAFRRTAAGRAATAFDPSDFPLVWQTLGLLREREPDARRFLEWGSGFGVVSGLACLRGFEAYGIEVVPALVDESRALLLDHGLDVEIAEGSYLPEGYEPPHALCDPSANTILEGTPAYDDLRLDLDEFDVVFSYPWPGNEQAHYHLFDRLAAPGALLVTYHGLDGIAVRRRFVRPRP